ncbi:MAG: hypothetical protein HQ546_06965 [Planctomycetes bacterium]|nr:hypothetical protein [Planctomycetota bacterium]
MSETHRSVHPDDELLIDFLTGHCLGGESRSIEQRIADDGQFARRGEKISRLLKLLDNCDAAELSEELIARTTAAVESAARTRALLEAEAAQRRPIYRSATFGLKELWVAAALLFLVAIILLPSFRHAGKLAMDQACQAQTGQIGAALTKYANDHNDILPALSAEDAAWLPDGPASVRYSNSRNLWNLVRSQYAKVDVFQCPADGSRHTIETAKMTAMPDFPAREFIGYSYHNGVNSRPLRLSGTVAKVASAMAILADRTPVFAGGRFNRDQLDCANSSNHSRRGQAVLFLDMHTAWANCAKVGFDGDNIWLVQGVSNYLGTERPASETDSFLLPSFIEDHN